MDFDKIAETAENWFPTLILFAGLIMQFYGAVENSISLLLSGVAMCWTSVIMLWIRIQNSRTRILMYQMQMQTLKEFRNVYMIAAGKKVKK